MSLAVAQVPPALGQRRVIALRQGYDEGMGVNEPRCPLRIRPTDRRIAERDIVVNAARENMEVLQDDANPVANVARRHIHDVDPVDQRRWPSLQGPHNAQNAAVAIAVARTLGLDDEEIEAGLASYAGLPHRMERIAEKNGVMFVNDSKATNPASSAPALAAYPPVEGRARIHWIVGGLPKGEGLGECEEWFGHVAHAYTIGEAGPAYAKLLEARGIAVTRAEMLCDAVRSAIIHADTGDVVLLSPACASFDQFRDFEARGDYFRQIVAALTAHVGPGETIDNPCSTGVGR